jgi:acyl-CoA reductase-like NAD-dependent aldehyde dehydrogenase
LKTIQTWRKPAKPAGQNWSVCFRPAQGGGRQQEITSVAFGGVFPETGGAMSTRLDVKKTYKLYLGGKFPRSESGRYLPAQSPSGEHLDNYAHASRKDFRDAVVAARTAAESWRGATAYNRGQILYRAAEMLQNRAGELVNEIARSTDVSAANARREVALAIDRLVHFAGWTDKYQQVFGSVNPVATSHFDFTTPEPTGVVVVLAPDAPSLLALVSLVAPVILSGNAAIAIPSEKFPLPAATFAEILATSDLPGGVVNLLTGRRAELAPHIAAHLDVNAIVDGAGDAELSAKLQAGTAINLKRYSRNSLAPAAWFTAKAEDPYRILDTVEFKTAWHPIGV